MNIDTLLAQPSLIAREDDPYSSYSTWHVLPVDSDGPVYVRGTLLKALARTLPKKRATPVVQMTDAIVITYRDGRGLIRLTGRARRRLVTKRERVQ